ncbi:MAG: hypothetical protein LC808_17885 [Actinobacteria bacterium]|nr:hypothetical protein [Actinomycetota bacterium]
MASIQRLSTKHLILATAVLVTVGNAFAYLLDVGGNDADDEDVGGFLAATLIAIGIGAFLIMWLIPRELSQRDTGRTARSALIVGALAFVTLVVFWTGLPFVLGVPALYLAAVALDRSGGIGDLEASPEQAVSPPPATATTPASGTADAPSGATPTQSTAAPQSDRRGMALGAAILSSLAIVLGLIEDVIG